MGTRLFVVGGKDIPSTVRLRTKVPRDLDVGGSATANLCCTSRSGRLVLVPRFRLTDYKKVGSCSNWLTIDKGEIWSVLVVRRGETHGLKLLLVFCGRSPFDTIQENLSPEAGLNPTHLLLRPLYSPWTPYFCVGLFRPWMSSPVSWPRIRTLSPTLLVVWVCSS